MSEQAASGPLGAQLWKMVLGRSRNGQGKNITPNYLSFKELGQMTKDVQLPEHVLGLYKYSCALGERLRPMIKPLADPVCSEAPWAGPVGTVEGDTQSSNKPSSPSQGGEVRRKSSSPHPSPPHQPASSSLFCVVFILHLLKISLEERFNPISAGVVGGWW